MDWQALSLSLRLAGWTVLARADRDFGGPGACVYRIAREILDGGVAGFAARAAADGPWLLPAGRHGRRLQPRSPLPGSLRTIACVQLCGIARRVGDLQFAVRDSTRATRLRGDSAGRARRRGVLRHVAWPGPGPHRAAAGVVGHSVRRGAEHSPIRWASSASCSWSAGAFPEKRRRSRSPSTTVHRHSTTLPPTGCH